MIAVIFEVEPNKGCEDAYFDTAAELKPLLGEIEGFISIERFESLAQPGKYLSLSFWENEEAVREWRTLESHRTAQSRGRSSIFKDYRLRVASVVRDYGLNDRDAEPDDSKGFHG